MAYKWTTGAVCAVKAEQAGTELERIIAKTGELRAETVVEESRPATAPLHACFEWDDSLAADKYRCGQAQYIVRNIIVVNEGGSEHRAFVNVKPVDASETERVYVRTVDAISDPEYRKQILQGALKEIEAWRKRYGEYAELARIVSAIEDTVMAVA